MKRSPFQILLCCILLVSFGTTGFAAKENFDRSKPHVNIGTIGHVDHGKTTLTAALAAAAKQPLHTRVIRYEDLDGTGRVEMDAFVTKIRTSHPQYWIHDFDPEGTIKNMVLGALPQDGAILSVSGAHGPTTLTREHVLLARQVGVPSIVVFVDTDGVEDPELLDLVEADIRRLLAIHQYDPGHTPVIRGSLSGALRGEADALVALADLMDALDRFVPRPVKPADQPFLMPIEDVFTITGRGTVATGRIETGRVSAGNPVEIVGLSETVARDVVEAVVVGGDPDAGAGEAGDDVGILLRGIEKTDIRRGMVIAKPGTTTHPTEFKAQVYVLTKEEGGADQPFFRGYRPQFYLRTADVTGAIDFEAKTEMIMPGDSGEIRVKLIVPVAMDKGLRFAIREGGRTVGAGQVTEIVK